MGGAILTLKVKMNSGGSVSLGFADRMNDGVVTLGLGIATKVNKLTTESVLYILKQSCLNGIPVNNKLQLHVCEWTFYIKSNILLFFNSGTQ